MRAVFNSNQFKKEMNNIVNYSLGFLEGVQKRKNIIFKNNGNGNGRINEAVYRFQCKS